MSIHYMNNEGQLATLTHEYNKAYSPESDQLINVFELPDPTFTVAEIASNASLEYNIFQYESSTIDLISHNDEGEKQGDNKLKNGCLKLKPNWNKYLHVLRTFLGASLVCFIIVGLSFAIGWPIFISIDSGETLLF